jgi:arginine/lysine/ornithine decarboxylase
MSHNHDRMPFVGALKEFDEEPHLTFAPPGHRQGRGTDPRVFEVLGPAVFGHDLLVTGGLDDRAAPLQQPHGADYVEGELQELALPVVGDATAKSAEVTYQESETRPSPSTTCSSS